MLADRCILEVLTTDPNPTLANGYEAASGTELSCPPRLDASPDHAPILGAWYPIAVRVISRKALKEFWEQHEDAEQPLRAWFKEARESIWRTPGDVKSQYASASTLPGNRVVFNIKGNQYRQLVVAVRYDREIVFIRFVGKHSEYDEIDATTI